MYLAQLSQRMILIKGKNIDILCQPMFMSAYFLQTDILSWVRNSYLTQDDTWGRYTCSRMNSTSVTCCIVSDYIMTYFQCQFREFLDPFLKKCECYGEQEIKPLIRVRMLYRKKTVPNDDCLPSLTKTRDTSQTVILRTYFFIPPSHSLRYL